MKRSDVTSTRHQARLFFKWFKRSDVTSTRHQTRLFFNNLNGQMWHAHDTKHAFSCNSWYPASVATRTLGRTRTHAHTHTQPSDHHLWLMSATMQGWCPWQCKAHVRDNARLKESGATNKLMGVRRVFGQGWNLILEGGGNSTALSAHLQGLNLSRGS
jgi:hypothetical protein